MSAIQNPTRRQALKLFSGAPFLPLGAASTAALLTACGGGDDVAAVAPGVTFTSAEFVSMAAPTAAQPAAMASVTVGSSLKVNFSDGSSQSYKLSYAPYFLTGDLVPATTGGTIVAGGYVNINNQPIIDTSVSGQERQFYSDSADGTSLITVANPTVSGIKGKAVFAVVQFEYNTRDQAGGDTYGRLPSPIAVLTLDQDQTTGKLSFVKYHNVDTSAAHGLWITCGSSVSPWGTHLSSEEYEPDAFAAGGSSADNQFRAYSTNVFGSSTTAKHYHYGHLPEVTVNPDGTGTVKKHYCMGRISHELIQVMPDNRTALMGDDNTNSGMFVFVADKEKDLSAGTLYVAKLGTGFSIDPTAAGCSISWIKIGHATSAEIEAMANTLAPSDIMEVLFTDPADVSYTKIFSNGVANWVKIKPGMDKAAAFLETHRYAYLKGGSMGYTKMEGTTVNVKDKIAYQALQNVQDSMVLNNVKGWNAASGISVPAQLKAGVIMQSTLAGGLKDDTNTAIDSQWMPVQTKALYAGEDIATDALGNTANPEKIANPDNLKFSEKLRTLFIGEDSSQHMNDFVWAYNVDTKKLSRLVSMPTGAEATGLGVNDDINGWTYITCNFQHPGDWPSTLTPSIKTTLTPLINTNYKNRSACAVGYLTADISSLKLTK